MDASTLRVVTALLSEINASLLSGVDVPSTRPGASDAGIDQVGGVRDVDLGDVLGEVAPVAGDEPVGAGADGGGQVGGVDGLQLVPGRQGRGQLGGGQVDRAQVKPGQKPGEDLNLIGRAVTQRLAEQFGQQQDRAGAGGPRAGEQLMDPLGAVRRRPARRGRRLPAPGRGQPRRR
jgi:hypothetical protein